MYYLNYIIEQCKKYGIVLPIYPNEHFEWYTPNHKFLGYSKDVLVHTKYFYPERFDHKYLLLPKSEYPVLQDYHYYLNQDAIYYSESGKGYLCDWVLLPPGEYTIYFWSQYKTPGGAFIKAISFRTFEEIFSPNVMAAYPTKNPPGLPDAWGWIAIPFKTNDPCILLLYAGEAWVYPKSYPPEWTITAYSLNSKPGSPEEITKGKAVKTIKVKKLDFCFEEEKYSYHELHDTPFANCAFNAIYIPVKSYWSGAVFKTTFYAIGKTILTINIDTFGSSVTIYCNGRKIGTYSHDTRHVIDLTKYAKGKIDLSIYWYAEHYRKVITIRLDGVVVPSPEYLPKFDYNPPAIPTYPHPKPKPYHPPSGHPTYPHPKPKPYHPPSGHPTSPQKQPQKKLPQKQTPQKQTPNVNYVLPTAAIIVGLLALATVEKRRR